MNDNRVKWAAAAVRQFQSETGTEFDNALSDLLADLHHWADRNALDFDHELSRARMHYEAETMPEDPIPSDIEDTATQDESAPPLIEPQVEQRSTTKKTYRAEFFTAADYAFRNFEAETPEQALELARAFYDENVIDLNFQSYEDNAGLDQIQIWDSERGRLASWKSDDYCRRQAAGDLLAALKLILPPYAVLLREVGADPNKSEAYQKAAAAIAKASPQDDKANDNIEPFSTGGPQ